MTRTAHTLRERMKDSPAARWSVLLLLSFTVMTGYVVADMAAPLKTLLEQAPTLWDSADYGLFTSGYGWLNVFLLMLIFGGIVLDRMGVRFTGTAAVLLMIGGTVLKYWALRTTFSDPLLHLPFHWTVKKQVVFAGLGFAVFGVGLEVTGIAASKALVEWFRGREMAMAIGLNTAFGRIGTLVGLSLTPKIADRVGDAALPFLLGAALLAAGLAAFFVFCVLDRKSDRSDRRPTEPAEGFRWRNLASIFANRSFWLITLLCVLFYSAVFPFLKFAPDFMVQKFGIPFRNAGEIPSLLPLGTLLLTPLFGWLFDRKGRGASMMILGSLLLVAVHLLFAVPQLNAVSVAVVLTVLLGVAFSLVPSALWPSVAKIVPENVLGTAYSLIFWVQTIGISLVPLFIGWVLDRFCRRGAALTDGKILQHYDYTLPMLIFALFGAASLGAALWLRSSDRKYRYGLEEPNIRR